MEGEGKLVEKNGTLLKGMKKNSANSVFQFCFLLHSPNVGLFENGKLTKKEM